MAKIKRKFNPKWKDKAKKVKNDVIKKTKRRKMKTQNLIVNKDTPNFSLKSVRNISIGHEKVIHFFSNDAFDFYLNDLIIIAEYNKPSNLPQEKWEIDDLITVPLKCSKIVSDDLKAKINFNKKFIIENLLSKYSFRAMSKWKFNDDDYIDSYIALKKFIDNEYINNYIRIYHTQNPKNKFSYNYDEIENNEYIAQPTWYPSLDQQHDEIETNSHFNMFRKTNLTNIPQVKETTTTNYVKTLKFELYPDEGQHKILQKWFDGVIDMYNVTNKCLKYLKAQYEIQQDELDKIEALKLEALELERKQKEGELKKMEALELERKQKEEEELNKLEALELERNKIEEEQQNDDDIPGRLLKKNKKNKKKKNKTKIPKQKKVAKPKIVKPKIVKPKRKIINWLPSFYDMRDKLKTVARQIIKNTQIPKHVLDYAVNDCICKYKACITNVMKDKIKNFDVSDLSKDKNRKYMEIELSQISKAMNGFSVKILGEMKSRDKIRFDKICLNNSTLQYTASSNRYFLISARKTTCMSEKVRTAKCGIDLGVRTFATVYSENGTQEIGTNLTNKINAYHKKRDKLQSEYSRGLIKRKLYEKLWKRNEDRMMNRMNDMHKKVASYLTTHYKEIRIGKIPVKKMTSNRNLRITKKTKRQMLTLSFCRFRKILEHIGAKNGSDVIFVSEYQTSMKCHNCGKLKRDLGSNKVYECSRCNVKLDRDINASINMMRQEVTQKVA